MSHAEIIQIADSFGSTGIGNYSEWVCKANPNNAKMFLMGDGKALNTEGCKLTQFDATMLPFGSNWFYSHYFPSLAYKNLKRELQREIRNDSIIHVLSYSVPFLEPRCNVVTIHDLIGVKMPENYSPSFSRYLTRNFGKYSKVDHAVVSTRYVKKDLENYGFEGKIHVIPFPVGEVFTDLNDKLNIRRKLGLPEDKIILLSVSSAEPRKNLKILGDLQKVLTDEYYIIRVGPGLNCNRVYEKVSQETLNLLYNASDILIAPSLEEGFGLPVIESMRCGLPVLASDLEFFHEIAGESVMSIDPKDVNSIKSGIREILSDYDNFKQKGKARSEAFSFQKFQTGLRELYDQL